MRRFWSTAAAVLWAVSLTACAGGATKPQAEAAGTSADAYPSKTIQVVIPFNAGSNTDTQYRFIQKYLEEKLGVSTAVVNNGGASGVIGTTGFLSETADGYTVLFSLPTPTVFKPAAGETEYTVEDLAPVSRVSSGAMYLIVRNDSPFETGEELIQFLKENPNTFTYGNAGNGGIAHLAFAAFLDGEGLSATSVPFSGGTADCYTAVMGGHVQSYCAGEQDLAGREDVKPLINLGTKSENPEFADVPTLEELGYSGYVTDNFSGFYFSKDAPAEVIETFDHAVEEMMADPAFLEAAKAQGFDVDYAGSEEFSAQVKSTVEHILPVLEKMESEN